ncbi:MAG: TlpA family protein disulfide reductase [Alkalicoccus sp.]|nr:MAG: TlpA family protein disulfide reductase [Alkalicoccus sp.]
MSMPAFELYDIEEKRKYSSEEFQGKPLIITFWVSWCPDCNRDLEAKKVFYEAMDSDRLNMVMIHVPGRESEKGAGLKHYHENNFPFLSLQDNGQKTYDAYQCMTLPTTVVIDKNGGVEAKFHDKASIQDMMPAVARVMM